MTARRILAATAVGRLLVGLALLLIPKQVAPRWLGHGAATPESAAFVMAVGGRDIAYAIGSLRAAREGDPRPWLVAGLLVDGTDAVATMRTEGVPFGTRLAGAAAAFGAVGLSLAGLFAGDDT